MTVDIVNTEIRDHAHLMDAEGTSDIEPKKHHIKKLLFERGFECSNFHLTVWQLKKACEKYPYLLLRFAGGSVMGLNTKVAKLSDKKFKPRDKQLTMFIGFVPCDLNEYISNKKPFLNNKK